MSRSNPGEWVETEGGYKTGKNFLKEHQKFATAYNDALAFSIQVFKIRFPSQGKRRIA